MKPREFYKARTQKLIRRVKKARIVTEQEEEPYVSPLAKERTVPRDPDDYRRFTLIFNHGIDPFAPADDDRTFAELIFELEAQGKLPDVR